MTWRPTGEDDYRYQSDDSLGDYRKDDLLGACRSDDLLRVALVPRTKLTALTTALNAAKHIITEPQARAPTAPVMKFLLDRYRWQMADILKEAAEQAAQQIARDITTAPPGQVQRSSVGDAGVEQDVPEAVIRETLLDFLENTFKLLVPEISPAIMPKEGEQPAPDPGEQRPQPEHTGIPFRGAETLFRRDHEQALSDQVVELKQQLAEERREKAELQRQLTEERREKAELQRQLAQAQAKQARQRAKANERQKQWREQNPDRAREQHTKHMRSYRARTRGQDS